VAGPFRHQDFLDELASGTQYGVFIDDTGSPGLRSSVSFLHPDRKSWVGVVVSPWHMAEVLDQFPGALDGLAQHTGAHEFHFADIYGGKGAFSGVDLQVRLVLFEFMAYLFQAYRFPIFVQTFDPTTLSKVRQQVGDDLPERLLSFDLTKPPDLALLFLLIWIKRHIEESRASHDVVARVFVDEGFKKAGIGLLMPSWETVFADGAVFFASSSSIHPIQLADFAAFCLNRTQLLRGRTQLSSLDRSFLEIVAPMAWNYQNIETRTVDLDDWPDCWDTAS
jgi:hypothetical protein